jgi:hypothetical protein
VPYDLPPPPPDVPAIVHQYAQPDFGQVRPGQEWLALAQQGPEVFLAPHVRAEAWDRWLANLPESENIEDRRSDDNRDMDDLRWRRAHGLLKKAPLVQFPPAPESRTPEWLKAQEDAYLKRKKQ